MKVIKSGLLHKKGLGFFAPTAHVLVPLSSLQQAKTRYFALCQKGGEQYELRYFMDTKPTQTTLEETTETLTVSPDLGLKGVYVLTATTTISMSDDGVLSIATRERTVLLCAETKQETEAWRDATLKAFTAARASQRMVSHVDTSSSSSSHHTNNKVETSTTTTTTTTSNNVPNSPSSSSSSPSRSSPLDTIEGVLSTPRLREKFRAFVKFAFAAENLDFYEACEKLDSITNDTEFKTQAKTLCERFVQENAPEQVNISAEQRKVLVSACMEGDDVQFMRFGFTIARKEIVDLLKRNFHARFRAREHDGEERARQRELLSGCFSQLWRTNGLDAFITVVNSSVAIRNDTQILIDYLSFKSDHAKQEIAQLAAAGQAFQHRAFQVPSLRSLAKAMRTVLDTVFLHIKSLNEFIDEFTLYVFQPLVQLQKDVDIGFAQITSSNNSRVSQILALRSQAKRAQDMETAAYQASEALKNEATNPKSPKKTKSAYEKALKDYETASAARVDAEIKMVEAESTHAEVFGTAMDTLQSLFLHRIDTIQLLLQRCVLAEQTTLSRLELRLSSVISDLAEVDSINDLVAFAEQSGKTASTDRRRMSVQQPTVMMVQAQQVLSPTAAAAASASATNNSNTIARQNSNGSTPNPRGLLSRR
jgi:hypothetical protein